MKINVIKFENLFFYITYFLFLLYSFFGSVSTYGNLLKHLNELSIGIILFTFIIQLKNIKNDELIRLLIFMGISLIYLFTSHSLVLIKLLVLIIISKNVSFDIKIRFDLIIRGIFLIIMIFLFKYGISTDVIFYKNNIIAHSIGFTNPNLFAFHVYIFLIEFLYLNKNKLNVPKIIIASAIMYICSMYSGCRTALMMYIISLVLFIIYKYDNQFYMKRIVKNIIINSAFVTSIIIFIVYILYIHNNTIGIIINKLLSSRISLISYFANLYPLSVFGTDITALSERSCDIAIVYILFSFGILGGILYFIIIKKLFRVLYKKNKIGIVILLFSLILYGMFEKTWLFANYSILITSIGYLIFYDKRESGLLEKND